MAAQPSCLPSLCVWVRNQYLCYLQLIFPCAHSFLKMFLERWEGHALNHDNVIICELISFIGVFQNKGARVFVRLHSKENWVPFTLHLVECLEQRDKQFNFQMQPLQWFSQLPQPSKCPSLASDRLLLLDSTGNCSCVFNAWHTQQQHISSALPMDSTPTWKEHFEGKKGQFHLQALLWY